MHRSPSRRQVLRGIGAAATTAAVSTSAAAADRDAARDVAQDTDVEALVDDLVGSALDEHDVPGATVAVVADGGVALTKGYGVADRDTERAVDDETPFRVGSVSKAILWTAVMRLVTRGKIDPDAPVSTYLDDVGLSNPYDEPVTMAHLATHRAGFDNSNLGLWIEDPADLGPLAAHLRAARRPLVRPPGEAGCYSNYGAALAGGVLEAVVDAPFERAIDSLLLDPAGMSTSSFVQPLPADVAENHATGYDAANIASPPGEFPSVGLRPAGSLSATATDMARFMQLHLNDGVLDGTRVLASETVDELHRRWATHHEALPGMAFGLLERPHGDVRTLWHNGATPAFYSDLVLVPERGLGLFVAYNASSGGAAHGDVRQGFLDALVPAADGGSSDSETSGTGMPTPGGQPTRAEALEGTYRSLRVSKTGHDRLTTTLQATTVEVSVADNGALVTDAGGRTNRWIEREPLVFEHVDRGELLAFGEGENDSIEYLFFGSNPATALGRIGVVDQFSTHTAVAVVSLLGMLSAVVGWPLLAGVRQYRSGDTAGDAVARLRAWRDHPAVATRLVASGSLFLLLGFVVLVVIHLAATPFAVLSTPPPTFRALFALSVLGTVGAVSATFLTGVAWRRHGPSLGRIHEAAVAASLLAFVWLLGYWNLLLPP